MAPLSPLEPAPAAVAGGREVHLKREDVHELGAFKWRGALPALERYRAEGAEGVVTASTGNHGAATAWAASGLGLDATVYVPAGASRAKLSLLAGLGADVLEVGADLDEAKDEAVAFARGSGLPFFEDGAEPAQLDGYAAIGHELVEQLDSPPAAVIVPVGNGALMAGVGRALTEDAPDTRRIGVVAAGAPVMARSWVECEAVECDVCSTIADGLAVRVAIPMAVEWLGETVDEMLQVSEREIAAAVAAFYAAGIRIEPAAAAALAALPQVDVGGAIVLVVTGRNIDDALLERCRTDLASFSDDRDTSLSPSQS
jgi:threonine dehydratase